MAKNERFEYSVKINHRRKRLFFPCDTNNDVEDSDLENMCPLSSSDTECNYGDDNIRSLRTHITLTPTTKNVSSEELMSPLYLSPCASAETGKDVTTLSLSPTRYLKTPNDTINSCSAPKLSRKSLNEQNILQHSPVHSKTSKVRTSLFPECDVSLAPTTFYPKTDMPPRINSLKLIPQQTVNKKSSHKFKQKKSKNKRIFGQINAGVIHKIKKPKIYKKSVNHISKISLSKIKTFKKDSIVIRKELGGFFNELEEFKRCKEIKLIEHVPARNTSNNSHNIENNLKRRLYESDDSCNKKLKFDNACIVNVGESIELLCDDPNVQCENISEILSLLDTYVEEEGNQSIETKNSNGIKIQGTQCTKETLLSPTSEMCNMTSVMKIDSPKKVKNLNLIFTGMTEKNLEKEQGSYSNEIMNKDKELYFPIFYKKRKTETSKYDQISSQFKEVSSSSLTNNRKKRQRLPSNQMILDAGQKQFGITECSECNYVYHAGNSNDEILHEKNHYASHILQFNGWKNEHVIEKSHDGRIIEVLPTDSKIWIEKVKSVIEVINRDLGYFDFPFDITNSKVLLFITNKKIAGCLVAEKRSKGYKVLSTDAEIDLCSTEEFPIVCGVSRIWVHPIYRKKGIGTKLMNILKTHFTPGNVLDNCDIAFSSPTANGKLFAAKYFMTQNFLTYFD